jgi:hypothetical protein
MDLNWKEAEFIMHCIELFADGNKSYSFTTDDGRQVLLSTQQVDDLYQRVQQIKFHDLDMECERRMQMAD